MPLVYRQTSWVLCPYVLAVGVAIWLATLWLPGWEVILPAAIIGLGVRLIVWTSQSYTLTQDHQLMCRHGIFKPVTDVYYVRRVARYTRYRRSVLGRILGFADLQIHSAGGTVTYRNIGRFDDFFRRLLAMAQ